MKSDVKLRGLWNKKHKKDRLHYTHSDYRKAELRMVANFCITETEILPTRVESHVKIPQMLKI